ncbi:MAG: hypothetical protein ACK56I_29705, partial [bacterium]
RHAARRQGLQRRRDGAGGELLRLVGGRAGFEAWQQQRRAFRPDGRDLVPQAEQRRLVAGQGGCIDLAQQAVDLGLEARQHERALFTRLDEVVLQRAAILE